MPQFFLKIPTGVEAFLGSSDEENRELRGQLRCRPGGIRVVENTI